ncbi:MAG: zinc-ribbon domain-containing protein [Oscillospiraceae bacterium]|nr:zinc-ribbon domain-containing protein [Oscillospiraceae bacterium]
MVCPNCGTQVDDNSIKCSNCGHEFREKESNENQENGNSLASSIQSARGRIQLKKAMIALSIITILLMILPWVKFVGKVDTAYSLFTLPQFAVDEKSWLYWILYKIWNHRGEKHFAAFAELVRVFAIIMVILQGMNIGSLLKDHRFQKVIAITTGLWSQVTTFYFMGWMIWFKSALMKYNNYSFEDVFHFTIVPYLIVIITDFTLFLSIKKHNQNSNSQINH